MSNTDEMIPNMDKLLKEALRPELFPPAGLNERILSGNRDVDPKRQKNGIRKWYTFPKAAVAAAALVLVGSAGVYAATKLLSDPVVTDHSISVGNTEYVDDEAIIASEEPATIEHVTAEKGDENVKWLTKDVEIVNGYTNTIYTFATYEEAAAEAGMDRWLGNEYVTVSPAAFTDVEGKGYHSKSVNVEFKVESGIVRINESVAEAGVAEDAAYSIKMQQPSNERIYNSENGLQFKLVDDTLTDGRVVTYVLIAYDRYTGYLSFEGLPDAEIYKVLENVSIQ